MPVGRPRGQADFLDLAPEGLGSRGAQSGRSFTARGEDVEVRIRAFLRMRRFFRSFLSCLVVSAVGIGTALAQATGAVVPAGTEPRAIAVDPSTGRAYLPSASLSPAPAGERPKAVPGSFRVLVVAP